MKKSSKKLALNRETVRALRCEQLAGAAGGARRSGIICDTVSILATCQNSCELKCMTLNGGGCGG